MRRAKHLGPLSPKLLKHFAAAAVVLTATLAVVASGDEWGAQAQIEAVDAKNQLVTTEAEKFGTKKLAAKLKVSSEVTAAGFANDNAGDFGGGSGDGGASYRQMARQDGQQPDALPANFPTSSGASITVPDVPINASPNADPTKRRAAAARPGVPSEAQLEAIKASSRERSNRSAQPDD